ncbi:MAG TPA: hypothetical protein VG077_04110 [Verrucomicrobiae bacterium]|nr:hypothetical protein [Verrucomicrobiae bacterium]
MNQKNVKLLLFILAILGALYSIYSLAYLPRQAAVRQVKHQYNAAVEQLNQSPPGIGRAEEFIQQLKAINIDHAPAEIQRDLQEYADTLNQALQTLKKSGNTTAYDKTIARERDKLAADFKKYD